MSVNSERILLESLIANQELIPLVEFDENWFIVKEYKEIATALIDSEGNFESIFDIEHAIKRKNPLTVVSYDKLSILRVNGSQTEYDNLEKINSLVARIKKEHFDEQLRKTSETYGLMPSEENQERLEYLIEQQEQFKKEEDDGSIKEALDEVLNAFFEEEPPGVLSYPMIDKQLNGGFENNTLTIIGARPSVGKTAFSLNLIFEMLSKNEDIVIDFFSLEMSKKQVMRRFASMMADINGYRLKNALKQANEEEYDRFLSTYSYLLHSDIRVFNDSKVDTVIKKIKKRHHEANGKTHIAFIDHISIMEVSNDRKMDKDRISEITRKLKNTTNDLDMPIVALSQLSRAVENRPDPKPNLSDLRDSGSAEQDASNVIFLYRPLIEDGYGNTAEDRNSINASFAKVRDGETGELEFNYFRDIQRIISK